MFLKKFVCPQDNLKVKKCLGHYKILNAKILTQILYSCFQKVKGRYVDDLNQSSGVLKVVSEIKTA